MAVMSMSTQEFNWLEVLLSVQSGRLRIADACQLIGIGRRQVLRLLRGLRQDGSPSLVSKRRGHRGNHRLTDAVRDLTLTLVREHYRDFGPTLATEKLAAVHGCTVSRDTPAAMDDRRRVVGRSTPPPARPASAASPARLSRRVGADRRLRTRLVRGPRICTLLAFIDDATSAS